MASPELYTYRDAVDAAIDYLTGAGSGSAQQKDIRRAVQAAVREVWSAHDWSWLYKHGRVHLHAVETTGTITYDHTGGTNERELTLVGATWPTWAENAVVRIDDVVSHVESRISDTVLTLDVTLNPGFDVDALTEFSIFPSYYVLPQDFHKFDGPMGESPWRLGTPVTPTEIMRIERYSDTTGSLRYYCVRSIDDLHGSLGLYISPPSDTAETNDFVYQRRCRQLRYSGHEATVDYPGTIVTNGTTSVVGTDTAFEDGMVGSVIRVGRDSTRIPTGLDGLYPFMEQRTIVAVTDTTNLTLDTVAATSLSGVKYCISDPIDIDVVAFNLFLRCIEKHLAIGRNMKHKGEAIALYNQTLFETRGHDCRDTTVRIMRRVPGRLSRFADATLTDET